MTFEELWEQLCSKQPALRDPSASVKFTAESLKTLLRQVHEQGAEANKSSNKLDPLDDQLFGRRF